MKQIAEANSSVGAAAFGAWRDAYVRERSAREHEQRMASLGNTLANAQASALDVARSVLSRMQGSSDAQLLGAAWGEWVRCVASAKEALAAEAAAKAAEERLAEVIK